jgi:hypothetical protein
MQAKGSLRADCRGSLTILDRYLAAANQHLDQAMNGNIKLNQRLSKRSAVQVQAKRKRPSRPEAGESAR